MKYLVCSDIHLNIDRRFKDTLDALGQILNLAPSLHVDKVLILGDVYTSRRPHSKERTMFQNWIKKLLGAVPNIEIVKGNHDEYPDGTHSYSEFTELKIPHVTVHNNPSIVDNFFLGHMLLREAKLGPVDYQHPDAMSTDELLAKFPDCRAYLLGDVHKHQLIRKDPLVVYAGSVNRVDFGERNDPKGVLFIDDRDEVGSYKFIELKSRSMIQYDIDLSEPLPSFPLKDIRDAIVKIIYHGTPKQMTKIANAGTWHDSIRKYCSELIVQHDVKHEAVARDVRVNESITSHKALELYLEKITDVSEEERAAIFKLGVGIIDATA